MSYALVKDQVVINVILWDGESEFEPQPGVTLLEVPDQVSIGWTLLDDIWTAPEGSELEPPPEEDPVVTDAKNAALLELTTLGISEAVARTIVGLPAID